MTERWTKIYVWYDGAIECASICFAGNDQLICVIERGSESEKRFRAHVERVADAIEAAIVCDEDNEVGYWSPRR